MQAVIETPSAVPIAQVRPVVRREGLWPQVVALARYMTQTEVHTYAFSVAANVILSLFPFIVMLLTLFRLVFHSRVMDPMVGEMMGVFLPANQHFIMDQMIKTLAHPHRLRMVQMLLRGRYTVGQLAEACGIPSHMASEHLRLMQRCGFLTSEKEGRKAYYRIVEPHLHDIMTCVEARFGGAV